MKVKIEDLDYYGRGVTKINGITIFVENALPDEIVEIEINNKKKKYMEGKVVKYISKSNSRCSFCNTLCGGCHLNYISYDNQLIFKRKKVKDIIKKFTKENIHICNIIPNPSPTNYRNKATFHIKDIIGYYKNKSHNIIEINECLIVDKKINTLFNFIKTNINLNNIYELIIRESKLTNDTMVIFKTNGNIDKMNIINKLQNMVTSIYIYNNKYIKLCGSDYIIDQIGDLSFIISPNSFFQVNTICAHLLYNQVLKYANLLCTDKVLDLYCGTGSIGLYLSKYCKEVLGIEIVQSAIMDANKNKELNNINNINFICGDISKLVNKLSNDFDIIIVDPPRAGLDNKTIDYLNNCACRKIIYVSCDIVTLARDLNLLKDKYKILEITPVDMFSYTYHVECVCVLKMR